MRCCDANDVGGDKSTNSEQLETITIADWDYSLASNATTVPYLAEPTGNNKCTQDSLEKSHIISSISDDELTQVKGTSRDNTYAEVASHQPSPTKNSQRMVAPKNKPPYHELPANIDDGFKGVQRRRNRIKRFFLSGIAESVKETNIRAYLEKRNVKSIHISICKSRREGTVSAKINIPAGDAKLVSTDGFWPMFVQCKPWQRTRDNQSIERGRNTILKGYYNSTSV